MKKFSDFKRDKGIEKDLIEIYALFAKNNSKIKI